MPCVRACRKLGKLTESRSADGRERQARDLYAPEAGRREVARLTTGAGRGPTAAVAARCRTWDQYRSRTFSPPGGLDDPLRAREKELFERLAADTGGGRAAESRRQVLGVLTWPVSARKPRCPGTCSPSSRTSPIVWRSPSTTRACTCRRGTRPSGCTVRCCPTCLRTGRRRLWPVTSSRAPPLGSDWYDAFVLPDACGSTRRLRPATPSARSATRSWGMAGSDDTAVSQRRQCRCGGSLRALPVGRDAQAPTQVCGRGRHRREGLRDVLLRRQGLGEGNEPSGAAGRDAGGAGHICGGSSFREAAVQVAI